MKRTRLRSFTVWQPGKQAVLLRVVIPFARSIQFSQQVFDAIASVGANGLDMLSMGAIDGNLRGPRAGLFQSGGLATVLPIMVPEAMHSDLRRSNQRPQA